MGIIIPQKLKKNRLHDILDSFLSGHIPQAWLRQFFPLHFEPILVICNFSEMAGFLNTHFLPADPRLISSSLGGKAFGTRSLVAAVGQRLEGLAEILLELHQRLHPAGPSV